MIRSVCRRRRTAFAFLIAVAAIPARVSLAKPAGAGSPTAAIPRVGVPSLNFSDGASGVRSNDSAPSVAYPSGVSLASSGNAPLLRQVGEAIGRNANALDMVTVTIAARSEAITQRGTIGRQGLKADSDWRFFAGDPPDAETEGFNDGSWRTVTLPHDWSIEGVSAKDNPSGAGGGYFPTGVGWYRKTFKAPATWLGKRVSIEFDGVYMDSTVYLNGQKIGTHPNGYTAFQLDLTPRLKIAATNVLAVRVDNSAQPNSRWYSGSGIYRHVRIQVTDPVHVDHWGVFVSTPEVSIGKAKVVVHTRIKNDGAVGSSITVQTILRSPGGARIASTTSEASFTIGMEQEITQALDVSTPSLWSPESPSLYSAVTRVTSKGGVLDEVVTPFGIRSLSWSAETGLALNGKGIKIHGGSVHHDNGPLGAAAFDRAEERKVELLKDAGFNAVRTAHNPPSSAFLDACDRLGLLVLDESFDVWTQSKVTFDYARHFKDWWQRDVAAMVLRDRNHPSVVMWGIGNEIPEVWGSSGPPIARELASYLRSLDSSRPITQAINGATRGEYPDAVMSTLDISGYNYNLAEHYAEDHRRVPSRLMLTTESYPSDAFEQWQMVNNNPYVVGEFVWTAMDYLGESGLGTWTYDTPENAAKAIALDRFFRKAIVELGADNSNPFAPLLSGPVPITEWGTFIAPGYPWHAVYSGDLDLTGFRKPQSYYRDMLWNGGDDRVYLTVRIPEVEGKKISVIGWSVFPTLPSWTWPGHEGETMHVDVYSRAAKVRLYCNNELIGEIPIQPSDGYKATFTLPYVPGVLKAVGLDGAKMVAMSALTTSEKPARLQLKADRTVLRADGQDLSFITLEAMDADGRFQPNAKHHIRLVISGPAVIAGVGNGDASNLASYKGAELDLFNGRALVIVRTSKNHGDIRVSASAPGLASSSVHLVTHSVGSVPELK